MELGNLVFGNSRGLFSVPREWDVVLARLFDAFEPPMSCHGRDFENGTFWIFPIIGMDAHVDGTLSIITTKLSLNWNTSRTAASVIGPELPGNTHLIDSS